MELGRNLNDWLIKMGIPVGGRSFKEVKDQTERITRCRLTFEIRHGKSGLMVEPKVIKSASSWRADPSQGTLFAQHARLSEAFFTSLQSTLCRLRKPPSGR